MAKKKKARRKATKSRKRLSGTKIIARLAHAVGLTGPRRRGTGGTGPRRRSTGGTGPRRPMK